MSYCHGFEMLSFLLNFSVFYVFVQEEYVVGDEVGRLQCEHKFHVDCIEQWLGLKNWCPICKASAAPSPSQSTLSPS